jgi:hypothetical protein
LVFAAGDAAGEGAAGLAVVAEVLTVALGEGDATGEGLAAVGVVDSGSAAQPAANPIGTIVRSRSAVRPILFIFEILITFCLVRAELKSGMMIARQGVSSNECSHSSFRYLFG